MFFFFIFQGYELKCAVAGVSSTDDKCHDGGEIKGKSILITGGFHKKKKGLITGGGHGLYLIELSGREKGSVLKRITQFKRVDGVSISTKQPDSSPQSSRSSSRASGGKPEKINSKIFLFSFSFFKISKNISFKYLLNLFCSKKIKKQSKLKEQFLIKFPFFHFLH